MALELDGTLACGLSLKLPVKGGETVDPPLLRRHATHQLAIFYGQDKAKIALITSTITGFQGSVVTQIAMRTWSSRYESQVDLERTLATGHFTEGDVSVEEQARAEKTLETAKTYTRKPPRSLCLEYYTYTDGYRCTKRTEFSHKHEFIPI
jgi:hypothetical protein